MRPVFGKALAQAAQDLLVEQHGRRALKPS
jgi:hypothetical protein